MHYTSLSHFLKEGADALAKGPIAMIFAEDEVEVDSTEAMAMPFAPMRTLATSDGSFSSP